MSVQLEVSRVDLRAAKLCIELDCNTIFDGAGFRPCPSCGSYESYPLESWLNQERLPKTASPQNLRDALGGDAACRADQTRWIRRLREMRAEGAADLGTSPLRLRARDARRRAG
jgi:hypothetical protein